MPSETPLPSYRSFGLDLSFSRKTTGSILIPFVFEPHPLLWQRVTSGDFRRGDVLIHSTERRAWTVGPESSNTWALIALPTWTRWNAISIRDIDSDVYRIRPSFEEGYLAWLDAVLGRLDEVDREWNRTITSAGVESLSLLLAREGDLRLPEYLHRRSSGGRPKVQLPKSIHSIPLPLP